MHEPQLQLRPQGISTIRTVYDLKRIINDLHLGEQAVKLTTKMKGVGPDGNPVTFQVTADSSGDYRSIILEGFKALNERVTAAKKIGDRAVKLIALDAHTWFDDHIAKYLGGSRAGLHIQWTIPDGTYEYNPIDKKLYKL